MPETINVRVNGAPVEVPAKTTVAAAILRAGGFSRTSVSGEPRSAFCGMGTCFECRCEINGEPHQRGCQRTCEPGMDIRITDPVAGDFFPDAESGEAGEEPGSAQWSATIGGGASAERLHFQVVVIGAGPAGIAAAIAASEAVGSVAVLDDNPSAGGQIWRGSAKGSDPTASTWLQRLKESPVQLISGARIFQLESGRLAAETERGALDISFGEVIVATGARELLLPFPGWTLRGVFGAGGLQALMKTGLPVHGKRIVIAGTGPLLLAVAAYARQHGAKIVAICEQAPSSNLVRFAMATARAPGKFRDALRFGWELRGVPYWTNCWPVVAMGREHVESVRMSRNGRPRELQCDYLACGFHLIPNVELPRLASCAIEDGFVRVDEFQRTSVPHVYCAGETTGIGGLDKSLVEGRIAGYAATGNESAARQLFRERARQQHFASRMKSAFALQPQLKSLASPDTLLCRCEDVAFGRASRFESWREAKLHTRCGMGACQGRVCGSAAELIFGWRVDSVRPPALAVRCGSLAAASVRGDRQEP